MPTNRLINESPYLLQHAHNPVDWFSWGEVALKKQNAKTRSLKTAKMILQSYTSSA
ncbi:DUF255 domain-containing protein [Bacillus haynesii]|nr:DUF255 domain-containing protein [Bacillus haynesii]MCY8543658.1 thioredoxin domain-containing protein [Bacillus haynesii]MEC1360150.1 DUF255 domain-containing protein [Bacillus haynesii]